MVVTDDREQDREMQSSQHSFQRGRYGHKRIDPFERVGCVGCNVIVFGAKGEPLVDRRS